MSASEFHKESPAYSDYFNESEMVKQTFLFGSTIYSYATVLIMFHELL